MRSPRPSGSSSAPLSSRTLASALSVMRITESVEVGDVIADQAIGELPSGLQAACWSRRATVHVDALAADVAGGVGDEEPDDAGHVLGLADATERARRVERPDVL